MAAWAPAAPATLLRALRSDVALRYVAIGDEDPAPSFPAHAAGYDLLHEDGEPEGAGGVLLLGFSALPDDGDDPLRERADRLRALLSPHRGYLGSRLYRSTAPAEFGTVTLVRWSSPLMYARALKQAEVAAAVPSPSALYLEVDRG